MKDPSTADIDERLKAMLGFLEKMTLEPGRLTKADGKALRTVGLSDGEIRDAIRVAFAFNLITRLADSFDFEIPTSGQFAKGAKMITKFGYKI